MMNLAKSGRYFLNRRARQATFWKPKHYEAIPHYVKPHFIDIHDTYQLRTLEEVQTELKDSQFEIEIERVVYNPTDIQGKIKGRKAILLADMSQF